jgi:Tfp pilus assembly protein PilX
MSVALQQGRTFQTTDAAKTASKRATGEEELSDFNKAVSEYATAHKAYVEGLLDEKTDPVKLSSLEKTANAKYTIVIATGTAVTSRTSTVIAEDDDAHYGAQIRELQQELSGVLNTLAKEQKGLSKMGVGGSTLDATTDNFKLQVTAEKTRYALWMVASVIVILLIVAYLA